MIKRLSRIQKFILVSLMLLCVFCLFAAVRRVWASMEDGESAPRTVSVSPDKMPPATIIIGTYIIDIRGLNDDVFSRANESATEFKQPFSYYRSEIGDGQWYKLDECKTLDDISTNGKPEDISVIQALGFTHSVDKEGVITDLRTGAKVSKYNDPTPLTTSALPEWKPLIDKHNELIDQANNSTQDPERDHYIQLMGDSILSAEKKVSEQVSDNKIDEIYYGEDYMNGLPDRGKDDDWQDVADEVLASEDAIRRSQIYSIYVSELNALYDRISGVGDTGNDTQQVTDKKLMNDCLDCVTATINNLQSSIGKYKAKIIIDSDASLAHSKYEYVEQLIDAFIKKDQDKSDEFTEKIVKLKALVEDDSSNIDENQLDSLVDAATDSISKSLEDGVNDSYYYADSDAEKKQIIESEKENLNTKISQLEALVERGINVKTNEDAKNFLMDEIDKSVDLKKKIHEDVISESMKDIIGDYQYWLKKKYSDLVVNEAAISVVSQIKEKIADLEKQREAAIADNDFAKAREIEAKIDAAQQDCDNEESRLNDIINSPNASKEEKVKAQSALNANTAKEIAKDLVQTIIDANKSKNEDAKADVAMKVLSDMSDTDRNAVKDALDKLDKVIEAARDKGEPVKELAEKYSTLKEKANAGSSSLSGITEAQWVSMIENYKKKSMSDMSDEEILQLLLVSDLLYKKTGNNAFYDFNYTYSLQLMQKGCPFIFKKYALSGMRYAPLENVAQVYNARYIYDVSKHTATLVYEKEKNVYEVGNTSVQVGDNTLEAMYPPVFQDCVYIHEEILQKTTEYESYYLKNTNYGILITTSNFDMAENLVSVMLATS